MRSRHRPPLPSSTSPLNTASFRDLRFTWRAKPTPRSQDTGNSTGPGDGKLPIEAFRDQILRTIKNNPVSVLIAPTGTGKSTMVPQYLLDAGYEQIIIVNPRRTPCVELAARVAELDGTPLGSRVGYRHGLQSEVSPDSRIIFTTDGYQLRRELKRPERPNTVYILDEFHEFKRDAELLFSILHERLEKGDDLKIVIATATLDTSAFRRYLSKVGIKAPIIEIHAKHYPIHDREPGPSIASDIAASSNSLTFLAGKKVIENVASDVRRLNPRLTILPMHAELPRSQQKEALDNIPPKAVLATNCAQTSLTFPNLERAVISGFVRRERLDDAGIRSLLIEEISDAEYRQQRGRVGRTKPGECVYHGIPLEELPIEIPAEIQNGALESTVLQFLAAGRDFTALNGRLYHPAPKAHIKHAMESLYNLDLIGPRGHITPLGRQVAELPVAVRSGKIIAWACKLSDELGLSPQELVVPAIDVAAIMEAQGIVERVSSYRSEFDTPHRNATPRWMKLCNSRHNSDALAQMQVFHRIDRLPVDRFEDWGIHAVNLQRARDVRLDLLGRLNLHPDLRAAEQIPLTELKQCIWNGMIDRLYRFVGTDKDSTHRKLYKSVVGRGGVREISRDSVVHSNSWIVAEPINIDREPYDRQPLKLLVMATGVDLKWIRTNHPPQLKQDILTAYEKTPQYRKKDPDRARQKYTNSMRTRGKKSRW